MRLCKGPAVIVDVTESGAVNRIYVLLSLGFQILSWFLQI